MPKQTKKPKKKESTKAITKPLPPDEVKKILLDFVGADCDPKRLIKKLGTEMASWQADESAKEPSDELNEAYRNAMPVVALETHYLAAESVSSRFRSFMIQFARDITEEYQCKTPSEKALAQSAAMSYGRMLELSSAFNSVHRIEFLSTEKNGFYGMLAKELDRAHRQFTSSMLVLKQMKSPTLEVNIKAKTAFVAQNQQVNASTGEPSSDNTKTVYENVDPK